MYHIRSHKISCVTRTWSDMNLLSTVTKRYISQIFGVKVSKEWKRILAMTFLLFFLSTNNAYRHEFNSIPKNNTKSMLRPYKRKGNMFFCTKKRKNENHELRFFECTEKCNNNAFLTSTKIKSREKEKKVDK